MSLSAGIALIVVLDAALIGFLAWMMSHPRHLTPHAQGLEQATAGAPAEQRFLLQAQDAVVARELSRLR